MKDQCEKCGTKARQSCAQKDMEWVWSSVLNGYGETPHLCGKCHDKVYSLIKGWFRQWLQGDKQ